MSLTGPASTASHVATTGASINSGPKADHRGLYISAARQKPTCVAPPNTTT
jgi:hypothetical protein